MTEPILPRGLCSVLVTPFDPAGQLDLRSLDRLVETMLDEGAHGLVVTSVMGEAQQLRDAEQQLVLRRVVERNDGRVPVLAGVMHWCTRAAARAAGHAAQHGASALLVGPPWAPGPQAMTDHFVSVAQASGLPLVLLDYPPLRRQTMDVQFVVDLVERMPQIQGITIEGPPVLPRVSRLRAHLGDRLRIYGAAGGLLSPQLLRRGADGLMTSYPYPQHLTELFEHSQSGKEATTAAHYARRLPLMVYASQAGQAIALCKEILCRRGIIVSASARPPVEALDRATRTELAQVLRRTVGSVRSVA